MNYDFFIYLSAFVTFAIEIVCGQLIFTTDLKKTRGELAFRIPIAILIILAATLISQICICFFDWTFLLNNLIYLLLFFVCIFAYGIVFKYDVKQIVLTSTLAYIFQHMVYKLKYLCFQTGLYSLIFQNFAFNDAIMVQFVIDCTFKAIIYVLYALLFRRKYIKSFQNNTNNKLVFVISVITLVFVITVNSMYESYNWGNMMVGIAISLFDIFACFLLFVIIFGLFKIAKEEEEKAKIELYFKEKIKQYENSKDNLDYINIKCHDLRKQLRALKSHNSLIDEDELNHMVELTRLYENNFDTHNETLNMVLSEKSLLAKKHNVELTCLIEGNSLGKLSKGDIYSLFDNILDNAIEASKKIDEKKRIISLVVKDDSGFIHIDETNYFDSDVEFVDGMPKTTNIDMINHGYGTKSMKYIVNKYDGEIKFSKFNDTFNVNILIPLN